MAAENGPACCENKREAVPSVVRGENDCSRSSVLRSCSHSQPKHLDYKRRAGPGMGDQVDSGAIDQEKQYRREEKESEIRACGHSQVNAYGRHLHISI